MVMRPYQIVATERILNRIEVSSNYRKAGTIEAGGYVWHTTGSGKTLTSFKTAQLATNLPYIDKVLFVVDRKDLDYQTIKEYERFEKGCGRSQHQHRSPAETAGRPGRKRKLSSVQDYRHHHPEAGHIHHQKPETSGARQPHRPDLR